MASCCRAPASPEVRGGRRLDPRCETLFVRGRRGRGPVDQPGGGPPLRPDRRPGAGHVLLADPGGRHSVQLYYWSPHRRGDGLQTETKPLPRPSLSLRAVPRLQVLHGLVHPRVHHLRHECRLQGQEVGVQPVDLPSGRLSAGGNIHQPNTRQVFPSVISTFPFL